MNLTTYIFGNLSSGYTQYPNDAAKDFLSKSIEYSTEKAQLIVYRSGVCIYYSYVRKLDTAGGLLGLSVMMNSVMLTDLDGIFRNFEDVFANIVLRGKIVGFSKDGRIIPLIPNLQIEVDEINRIDSLLRKNFSNMEGGALPLSPVHYETNKDRVSRYTLSDKNPEKISDLALNGYTCIYKGNNLSALSLDGYSRMINKLNKEKEEKEKRCQELNRKLKNAERVQRNTTLVAILGGIVLILGIVLWNKVLFPSEVTNYNAGEYMYYGPMSKGKPNGVGVAIYKEKDKDGRKYYIGNFSNGVRMDDEAMLYYVNGNYFYGSINGENLINGMFYVNSDNSHFQGSFYNNEPESGTWYEHVKAYDVND